MIAYFFSAFFVLLKRCFFAVLLRGLRFYFAVLLVYGYFHLANLF